VFELGGRPIISIFLKYLNNVFHFFISTKRNWILIIIIILTNDRWKYIVNNNKKKKVVNEKIAFTCITNNFFFLQNQLSFLGIGISLRVNLWFRNVFGLISLYGETKHLKNIWSKQNKTSMSSIFLTCYSAHVDNKTSNFFTHNIKEKVAKYVANNNRTWHRENTESKPNKYSCHDKCFYKVKVNTNEDEIR